MAWRPVEVVGRLSAKRTTGLAKGAAGERKTHFRRAGRLSDVRVAHDLNRWRVAKSERSVRMPGRIRPVGPSSQVPGQPRDEWRGRRGKENSASRASERPKGGRSVNFNSSNIPESRDRSCFFRKKSTGQPAVDFFPVPIPGDTKNGNRFHRSQWMGVAVCFLAKARLPPTHISISSTQSRASSTGFLS